MCMKRTALFLKQEQLKKLLALSEKTGASVAELIRRAIDRYLRSDPRNSSKRSASPSVAPRAVPKSTQGEIKWS
jgi:hypothetical protein